MIRSGQLSGALTTVTHPTSTASEAYRTLRTSLMYAFLDAPPKVIVVSSPGVAEGKSTTCANLAVVLAQAEKNTLVMDCDFRRPTLHSMFMLRNATGLVNVLAGERNLSEVWQEPVPGLKVITAGLIAPNTAELLSSRRFAELIQHVRDQFDYVLIDAPPVNLVSDPVILATQGDGILLVVDSQNTRKGSVQQCVHTLETVGAKILGAVMNKTEVAKRSDYYYQYGHEQRRGFKERILSWLRIRPVTTR